mmetsp:Transcript_19746/g.37031  ORF Transcript_19746/g.37031 Transcript_19746/m.37031 type:complete len:1017 (+) Transcript_19746:97-3147(+)
MAMSLDMIFDMTVPLWLEMSCAVVIAVLLALVKITYNPNSQRKKVPGEVSDAPVGRAAFALSQNIEADVAAGKSASALAAWRSVKKRCTLPVDALPHLVRAFLEADPDALTSELLEHMRTHAATLATPKAAAAVLDTIARSGRVQLLEELAAAFQQRLHIPRGTAMYEALLNGFAAAGCKEKVNELIAQMRAKRLKVTVRGFSLIIKGYLRNGLLDEALFHIHEMRSQGFHLPSFAVAEIFRAAREAGRSEEMLDKVIVELKLSQDAVTVLLEDCLTRHDRALAERVTFLSGEAGLPLAHAASEALLRLYANTGDLKALSVLDDMQRSGSLRFTEGFCVGILTRCAEAKFLRLAEEVVRRARAQEGKMTVTLYSALMKVYAYCGLYSRACDLYEQLIADGLQPDSIMYGCVLRFANECGRSSLVQQLSDKVDACDVQHCMSLMRAAGSEGKLDRAFEHFKKLKVAGGKPDVASYNCLVDVCVNAGDMKRARMLLEDMRSIGHVDKISYNTMVKGYCAFHDAHAAKKMLKEMEAAGFSPNDITFNSLINMAGSSGNMSDAWGYLRDMQERGIVLDKYTICTMLKSLRRSGGSRKDHLSVLELLDELNLDICGDEVLLNMVLDACIRQAKQQRLETILAAYEKSCLRPAAHTYGSLVRAYSALKRLDRCRALWSEMMDDRRMELNSIVFGCMLDALVCSGCMEEALTLFNKWKGCVSGNSVIYSTLMKGFANSHLPEQAMSLFHEMRASGIRPTTTSYNTVADAQARVGNATAVQKLVDLMKEDQCRPDHVTHSIMVKAFCIAGNLEQAFQVFKTMQMPDANFSSRAGVGSRDGSVTIAFNTLLDGCIKHNKMSLADQLLDQVEEFGVQPTNFTLCIFLKMCGRRRQLMRAMRAAENWPKKYNFSTNSAVRTCLMSACLKCESVESALKIFQDGKSSGLADAKAYGVLIAGCVRHGALEPAIQLVDEAYSLNRTDGLDTTVVEHLIQLLTEKGLGDRIGQPLLQRLRAAGVSVGAAGQ